MEPPNKERIAMYDAWLVGYNIEKSEHGFMAWVFVGVYSSEEKAVEAVLAARKINPNLPCWIGPTVIDQPPGPYEEWKDPGPGSAAAPVQPDVTAKFNEAILKNKIEERMN